MKLSSVRTKNAHCIKFCNIHEKICFIFCLYVYRYRIKASILWTNWTEMRINRLMVFRPLIRNSIQIQQVVLGFKYLHGRTDGRTYPSIRRTSFSILNVKWLMKFQNVDWRGIKAENLHNYELNHYIWMHLIVYSW